VDAIGPFGTVDPIGTVQSVDPAAPLGAVVKRALVVGGTGMLSGCVAELVRDGWQVVVPSRRYAPIPADLPEPADESRQALWVEADWAAPESFAERAEKALNGRAELLVAWVHDAYRAAVLAAVAPLLTPEAAVVEVLGSAAAQPLAGTAEPTLPEHDTQLVVLGFVRDGESTRWLTHRETSEGVLDAVHRALAGRPPAVHQIGEVSQYSIRI
jgi:NAD(P)-dependent dehydrogenase (short-subunit alcohol dehydrogenase family)